MSRQVSMQFGKPGGVANRSGDSSGYYSPGETFKWSVYNDLSPEDTPGGVRLPADVYSAKAFAVTVILPKSVSDNVTGVTVNSFRGAIRSTGGYIGGTTMNWHAQWVGKSGISFGGVICNNLITIPIMSTSNLTNATANRPATAEVTEIELTFS